MKRYKIMSGDALRERENGEVVYYADVVTLLAGLVVWSEEASMTCGRAANGYEHDAPMCANLRSRQRAYQECGVKIQAAIAKFKETT